MPRVDLDEYEIHLLMEALDSHEYWQLAEEDERSNGYVFIPGDRDSGEVSQDEDERHEEIRACRALAEKLRAALASAEARAPAG